MRYREADGEWYVYVEDLQRRRLAGYTVFNRLVELDRRADRHLRAPHSRYDTPYQRRGLASAVYRWALQEGWCLVSGARQSPGAHALWHQLCPAARLGLRGSARQGRHLPGPGSGAAGAGRPAGAYGPAGRRLDAGAPAQCHPYAWGAVQLTVARLQCIAIMALRAGAGKLCARAGFCLTAPSSESCPCPCPAPNVFP